MKRLMLSENLPEKSSWQHWTLSYLWGWCLGSSSWPPSSATTRSLWSSSRHSHSACVTVRFHLHKTRQSSEAYSSFSLQVLYRFKVYPGFTHDPDAFRYCVNWNMTSGVVLEVCWQSRMNKLVCLAWTDHQQSTRDKKDHVRVKPMWENNPFNLD